MLYINGEWRETANKQEVINPATREVIQLITTGSTQETREAIICAREAFDTWGKTTGNERNQYLAKVVNIMKEKTEHLAKTITSENGKSLQDAMKEVNSAIEYLVWYAEEAKRIYGDTLPPSQSDKHLMVLRQPIGVVAAITPWNFPLSMIARKIAPALSAGCTVVLKPAPQTPLSAIELFKCFHEAEIPKGVVNLVIGDAEKIGNEMTSNTAVKKVTFTGSTKVGKKLMKASADTVKKVSMELGGHAPFIIFDDANLDEAVEGIMLSKFKNSGQTCISTNRIYVAESIVAEFGRKLASKASKLKVGNGTDDGVDVGPLINKEALKKVSEHVEDAIQQDGEVICGGHPYEDGKNKGYFYEPTVIQNANEHMKIANEETFGPVAPIFTFKTEEEVLKKANGSTYGLAAYCYTRDMGRGFRMLENLEFGIVGINDPTPIVIQAPFGGLKESGMGKEGGKYGLLEYLEEKYVSIRTS